MILKSSRFSSRTRISSLRRSLHCLRANTQSLVSFAAISACAIRAARASFVGSVQHRHTNPSPAPVA